MGVKLRAGVLLHHTSLLSGLKRRLEEEEDAARVLAVLWTHLRIQIHPGRGHPVRWEVLRAAQAGMSPAGRSLRGPGLSCHRLFTLLQPECPGQH